MGRADGRWARVLPVPLDRTAPNSIHSFDNHLQVLDLRSEMGTEINLITGDTAIPGSHSIVLSKKNIQEGFSGVVPDAPPQSRCIFEYVASISSFFSLCLMSMFMDVDLQGIPGTVSSPIHTAICQMSF